MKSQEAFSLQFRELQTKFSKYFAFVLNRDKLTLPQYALLGSLIFSGEISMTEISGKLHITKPAVTSLVDRLEKKGFLKRTPHPQDRRIYLLKIQPKGKKIVHKIQGKILGFLFKTLDQFDSTEQKTILKFYTLMSQEMDQMLIPCFGASK